MKTKQLLTLIRRDGVALIEDFLKDSQIESLIATCRNLYRGGQYDPAVVKSGIKTIASPGKDNYILSFRPVNVGSAAYDLGLKPVSDVFLSSPIAELSKKYLGWNWNSHSIVFDDREFTNELVGTWHTDNTDDSRTCLKFYLYLSDTPQGHGEFQYVKKSHIVTKYVARRLGSTHNIKELLHDREALVEELDKLEGSSSEFRQLVSDDASVLDDIRTLSESSDCDAGRFMYPGRRGTLLVFDSHGLHRGGLSLGGRRIILRSHHLANPTFKSLWNTRATTIRAIRRLGYRSSINSYFC
jgi:hypothetical protein